MTGSDAFDVVRPRYDQTTYAGRVRGFFDVIHPRGLIASTAELQAAQDLLQTYRSIGRAPDNVSNEDLWRARSLVEVIIHPDTGKPIPAPFRFAAFIPMNLPICAGMLSASSIPATIFWQWINQSYNVAVNFSNRNASNEMSQEQIAKAYAAAVGASCSISVGLNQLVKHKALRQMVPFVAVASAGAINVILMRYNELVDGIEIKTDAGQVVGKSQLAGRSALSQVALTRVVLPAPILILPPLILNLLRKRNAMPGNPRAKMLVELGIISVCLTGAVPLAIGLFPQESRINARDLEPEFQNIKDSSGNLVTKFIFNKGL